MESHDFTIITNSADQNTLVVFDIDNTIGRYENGLGNDEWFSHLVKQKVDEGHDHLDAMYLTLPLVYYAHFSLPLTLTDNSLPSIISSLASKNINVIALTARSLYLAERTKDQLHELNINFWMNHHKQEFLLPLQHLSGYKNNMLFTSNNDKGETLRCFLQKLDYQPKKVIFIDDKMVNVIAVEKAMHNTGIETMCIRYTGCDHHVTNFDPMATENQWPNIKKPQ